MNDNKRGNDNARQQEMNQSGLDMKKGLAVKNKRITENENYLIQLPACFYFPEQLHLIR